MNRKEFFLQNIGKRFWRNKLNCNCETCLHVSENGIVPESKLEVLYLYDIETEFTAEGHPTRYFLTKEEAQNYEKQLENERNQS